MTRAFKLCVVVLLLFIITDATTYFFNSSYYLRNRNMIRGNAHAAIHLRAINQFLKLVYLRK